MNLRQVDLALGQRLKVPEVCRQFGISVEAWCCSRTKYSETARQMEALPRSPTSNQSVSSLTRPGMKSDKGAL